jgi:hypothetical protein
MWMQGIQLGNSFGTEARGVVVHLFRIEKIGIGCFNYQGMVLMRG